MKKEACDCGVDHWWISWRGYNFGPFSEGVADQIMQVGGGMGEEITAAVQEDPIGRMVMGAVLNLPPAVDCK